MDLQTLDIRGLLSFQIERKFLSSAKLTLSILEKFRDNYGIDEIEFQHARTRILDVANTNTREIKEILGQMDLTIK